MVGYRAVCDVTVRNMECLIIILQVDLRQMKAAELISTVRSEGTKFDMYVLNHL